MQPAFLGYRRAHEAVAGVRTFLFYITRFMPELKHRSW